MASRGRSGLNLWARRGLLRGLALVCTLFWAGLAAAKGPLFLWEVLDSGGALRGYLYGTIHVCDAACFPLPREVGQAFLAADSLALELDPKDPALGPALARAGMLPEGQRLDERLPADLRPRLDAVARQLGLAPAMLQRMQPWMASTLLTLRAAGSAGFVTEQGVDLWLARAAHERGLPLYALETVERQLEALAAGGDQAQAAGVAEVVDMVERGDAREYFTELLEAWRSGDVERVDSLLRDEGASEQMAPMLAEVLDARNREMADAIKARLVPGTRPFVAVGAGHFGQKSGLLAELGARGFRTKQVVGE